MLPRMVVAGLLVCASLGFAPTAAPPRLVAHARIHSFAAFESMFHEAYGAQGFGAVYGSADRFAPLRALVGEDVADRPCAFALVADDAGEAHLVGVAPDAVHPQPFERPLAQGADPIVCEWVAGLAREQRWLAHAADDDAQLRLFVDVAALREVWRQKLEGLATMARSMATLRAVLARSSPLLESAVDLLERSVCSLDAWSSLELAIGHHAGKWDVRVTLVPEAGSAAELGLKTWQPLPMPSERIDFVAADLQGFVGASDVDVHALLCEGNPEDASAAARELEVLGRSGGVFAFRAASPEAALIVPYGAHPVGEPSWPADWRAAATRCMSPLGAGDSVGNDPLYVRLRPAAWLDALYARVDARMRVPERAADGWIEVRGRARAGALVLDVRLDEAALAALIPELRFG